MARVRSKVWPGLTHAVCETRRRADGGVEDDPCAIAGSGVGEFAAAGRAGPRAATNATDPVPSTLRD